MRRNCSPTVEKVLGRILVGRNFISPGHLDKGGRRLGSDRRETPIPEFQPERRLCQDRRTAQDRRGPGQGDTSYLRRNMDQYNEFRNANEGLIYGALLSSPIWAAVIFVVMSKL
jgi:hypothetical protein